MRSILQFGIISTVISLAFGQLENNEPTHIIKFKTSVNRAAGNLKTILSPKNVINHPLFS